MKETLTRWTTRALLAFVLVSIGFAVGRESARRSLSVPAASPAGPTPAAATADGDQQVGVYYLHASIRCSTCNSIEARTRRILDTRFAPEVAAGKVLWQSIDFQANEELAKRYDVASSVVVIVRLKGGRDAAFQRLDKVWTLLEKPDEFDAYVAEAIRKYLTGGTGS